METIRYLRALGRSWWLIAVTLIAGGAGGFLVYHGTTPTYESGIRLIVAANLPNADPVSASALTAQQATSLAMIAGTGPAISSAIAASGAGPAGYDVSVQASSSSSFVTISVSGPNARVAALVAAAFPRTLPKSQKQLAGSTNGQFTLNVVASPGIATDPVSPDPVRDIGLGLAAGLILGIAIAILRETLNRTMRDTDALRELTGLTVLGTIPRDMAKKLLPAMSDPRSARAEAYRQVRTTLLNQATVRPLTFAVTSAALGEGKTSVACNVAAIFSRAGHRVVLVDADLRRPRVATFFDVSPQYGLSDLLAGTVSLDEAMTEVDEGRLVLVTAGKIPPNPAELLGSKAMTDLLADLAAEFEFVIIDTPPVLPVTDALVVGPLVDGIVVVVKLGGTTQERIEHALAGIDRVNARIIGIVPNQADQGADRSYGYAYRYTTGRRRSGGDSTVVPEPSAGVANVRASAGGRGSDSAEQPAAEPGGRRRAEENGGRRSRSSHRAQSGGQAASHELENVGSDTSVGLDLPWIEGAEAGTPESSSAGETAPGETAAYGTASEDSISVSTTGDEDQPDVPRN